MPVLRIVSGPLAGREYDSLTDYLVDQHEIQESCPHDGRIERELVSGINTDNPRHVRSWRCEYCGLGGIIESRPLTVQERVRERQAAGYAVPLVDLIYVTVMESIERFGVALLDRGEFCRLPCSQRQLYAVCRRQADAWGLRYHKAEYVPSGNRPFQRNHKRGKRHAPSLSKREF